MHTTVAFPGAQRILRGAVDPVCRVVLLDQDGAAQAGAGTVTATVRNPFDGSTVGTANRATVDATGGAYTVALTSAEAAAPVNYAVDWYDGSTFRTTSHVRVVGGLLVTSAEILDGRSSLADFSSAHVAAARDWISDLVEHQTGVAWAPRQDVHEVRILNARDRLVLDFRPVVSIDAITVDGTDQSADIEFDPQSGILSNVTFFDMVRVRYTHGHQAAPVDLRRAAQVAAADALLRNTSKLTERTRSVTNEMGLVQQMSFPGLDHPTGIDFVDAAVMAHDQRIPNFG